MTVIHKIAVVLSALILLTGCSTEREAQDTPVPDDPGQVSVSQPEIDVAPDVDETEAVEETVTEESGQVVETRDESTGDITRVYEGMEPDWFGDVPVMDGYEVTRIVETYIAEYDMTSYNVDMNGDVPIADVREFYSGLAGWESDPNTLLREGDSVDLYVGSFVNGQMWMHITAVRWEEGVTSLSVTMLPER